MRRIIVSLNLTKLGLKKNTIALALFCECDDFGFGTLRYANFDEGDVVLQFDYDGNMLPKQFNQNIESAAVAIAARCIEQAKDDKFINYEADGLNLVYKGNR